MLGNFIAERRQSRQSRRTYCPRKVFDFAAAFGGVANNFVVCNRGQYIMRSGIKILPFGQTFSSDQRGDLHSNPQLIYLAHCKMNVQPQTKKLSKTADPWYN